MPAALKKTMKKNISLLTDRLKIKLLQVNDITPSYVDGLNDPEVNKFLVNVRLQKQTKKSVADYILFNLQSRTDLLLGIFLKNEGDLIGTIRVSDISNFHYLCTIGICLFHKKYWGNGYALEALNKVSEFVFDRLGIHYIEAGVYADNISSINLFNRAGFSVKCVNRDKFRLDNTFAEVITFGKINSKFDHSLLAIKRSDGKA